MRISRRLLATAAAAALLLTGCATGGDAGSTTDTDGESAAGEGTFPQTVTTAFGDVTIDEAPERVVALGWSDAETALALGVQPVGASDWLGFGGEGVGPWAEGMYDEAPEIIETLEPCARAATPTATNGSPRSPRPSACPKVARATSRASTSRSR
jgi:iron complex transport system substrate-binding protein